MAKKPTHRPVESYKLMTNFWVDFNHKIRRSLSCCDRVMPVVVHA